MAFVNSNDDARAGGPFNYIRFMLRLRIPLSIAAMVFAVLGLASNYLGVDIVRSPLADGAATHPITALCLLGVGVGAYHAKRFGRTPVWQHLIGGGVILICVARLMQAEVSQMTGAPALDMFGPAAGFGGHFSIESAIILGSLATANVLRQGMGRWGLVFGVMAIATIFNTTLEMSYGLTFFNGNVGIFTVLGLMCAAVAITTLYLHRPIIRVCFQVGNIGNQTRVMALAAIAIPWACGYFLHSVRDISSAGVPFEAAMVSIITWSMLIILLNTAAHLESSDTARRRAEREVAMLSRIDPQTKALNRFGMSEVLDSAWVEFKSTGSMFGMLMLDVDYFRRINETFGQGATDDVLERVAATVRDQLRDQDAFGRWTGEEFLILLKVKALSDLDVVVGRLSEALGDANNPFCSGLDGLPKSITPTFGKAHMRDDDRGAADMISRADSALHIIKCAEKDQSGTLYELDDEMAELIFHDDTDQFGGDQQDGNTGIAA